MPIYEYECKACGDRHEAIQKLKDAPLTDCPTCGKPELKKLVSAVGFRLAGSGWYETDFKKDGKRNLAETESKKAEKDSKQSEASKKKDSKQSSETSDKSKAKESKKSATGDK